MSTLADLFYRVETQARRDLLMERRGACFEPVGATEFGERARRCAAALGHFGIGRGDRVGLICSNRPEWHVIDFACHLQGAVLVPLFASLTPPQVRYVFGDSGCAVVFAEGSEQLDKVASVRTGLPELRCLVLLREADTGADDATEVTTSNARAERPSAGAGETPETPGQSADAEFEELLAAHAAEAIYPGPESGGALATIIYTSGTTGQSKGVMLTHDNLISNVRGSSQVLDCRPEDCALSVLPLSHVFQRIVDYTFFSAGAQIAYGSATNLAEDYLAVRPTVVAGVPRLFERFRAAVLEQVATRSTIEQAVFGWAESVGRRHAEHELEGGPWTLPDRLRFALADRLVLRKVRAGAGGRIYHFVSGGAALDPSLNWWFESMGLRLLQGYGLTETSPVISANPHDANRIGTVGTPIPGVEVKIAPDGEILTRGPHVMKGYWNLPEETAQMIVDGWLHTGDIGSFTDGYLSVTDRKKHMLVTSTGKNVAPQPLENLLVRSRYVEQVAVVGDGRPFIAALIVPDFGALRSWAGEKGKAVEREALCADADVADLVRSEIDPLQSDRSGFERVRAFRLLPKPFSIADGTLTPTLKTVRKKIEETYAHLIEDIYGEKRG